MNVHLFPKRRHLLRKFPTRFFAQHFRPRIQRLPSRLIQPIDRFRLHPPRQRNRRKLRLKKYLVGIRIADSTEQMRIGERPLQRVIFRREHGGKRLARSRKHFQPARIDRRHRGLIRK